MYSRTYTQEPVKVKLKTDIFRLNNNMYLGNGKKGKDEEDEEDEEEDIEDMIENQEDVIEKKIKKLKKEEKGSNPIEPTKYFDVIKGMPFWAFQTCKCCGGAANYEDDIPKSTVIDQRNIEAFFLVVGGTLVVLILWLSVI